jgi:hypothetical protein
VLADLAQGAVQDRDRVRNPEDRHREADEDRDRAAQEWYWIRLGERFRVGGRRVATTMETGMTVTAIERRNWAGKWVRAERALSWMAISTSKQSAHPAGIRDLLVSAC